MDITTILLLVWIHAIFDFIFQTETMAKNKSKSIKWLTYHVIVYTIPFTLFGWLYALVNGVLHWITDFFTSKVSSYFNQRGENKKFFITVGIDQAIHMTTLFGTYWLMFH